MSYGSCELDLWNAVKGKNYLVVIKLIRSANHLFILKKELTSGKSTALYKAS